MANLVALPLLIFLIGLLKGRSPPTEKKIKCKFLKIDRHSAYRVPKVIRPETTEAEHISKKYILTQDFLYFCTLFINKKCFNFELMLKFFRWMAFVTPYLDKYQPEYLIQYCEYSPHSSLRKFYLNQRMIRLANVSHGEELISCRSAFSTFDAYYVWNIVPKSVHSAMHIEAALRVPFDPCEDYPRAPLVCNLTVGLLWPVKRGALAKIISAKLKCQITEISKIASVIIRPHPNPLYRSGLSVDEFQDRIKTSDSTKEDIHDFIDRCSIIVGFMSAALVQASSRNRQVLYLTDKYLLSAASSNDYYKDKSAVEVDDMAQFIFNKYSNP